MVYVGFGTGGVGNDLLDEEGNLGHDVNPIKPGIERTFQDCLNVFAILRLALPLVPCLFWLRPTILGVLLELDMCGFVCRSRINNLVALDDGADIDNSRPVRRRGGELHHDGGVVWALEVGKVPSGSEVVRLHALEAVDEDSLALEVDGPILRHDGALCCIPRPEDMSHGAPWSSGVSAKVGGAILTDLEARGDTLDGDIDNGLFVGERLDAVGGAVL